MPLRALLKSAEAYNLNNVCNAALTSANRPAACPRTFTVTHKQSITNWIIPQDIRRVKKSFQYIEPAAGKTVGCTGYGKNVKKCKKRVRKVILPSKQAINLSYSRSEHKHSFTLGPMGKHHPLVLNQPQLKI